MSESPAPPDVAAPEPQPTRRRRVWRWFRKWGARAAIVALVWTALYAVYLVSARQAARAAGNRELAAALAETDAADPDWTWERLNAARPRPPVGKNGADVIHRFHAALPKDWRDGAIRPEKWEPEVPPLAPNVRLPASALKSGEAVLARVPEALALARSLRDTPTGFREYHLKPAVFATLLPDVQPTRTAALLLKWDAELALEGGDKPRALAALGAQLNAARSLGDEPFAISQLVRVAVRVLAARSMERALAHAQFAESELAALQRAWTDEAEEPLLATALRGERAAQNELFHNLTEGTTTLDELTGPASEPDLEQRATNWLMRGRFPAARAHQLRWFNDAIAASRLPSEFQLEALPGPLPRETTDPALKIAGLLLPAAHKLASATVRGTADARCVVAGLACERFRLKHGRFPNALAELVPAFLPAVPLDAFTGEPLGYEKCDGGAIVFSVGQNRTDTAGTLDEPPVEPAKTIDPVRTRFRLYDPDQRHRPAPPEPEPLEPDPNP